MQNHLHKSFNSQHSPVGAFASFTLGYPGASGGFGLELGQSANQDIYIGAECPDEKGSFEAFPFFKESVNIQDEFVLHDQGDVETLASLSPIDWDRIEREFKMCSDSWSAGDLKFEIFSPSWKLPEPGQGDEESLKQALIPAVFAEFTIDNRSNSNARRVFFGYQPTNYEDHIRENWGLEKEGVVSLCSARKYGVATDKAGANTGIHFTLEHILGEEDRDRFHFGNGTTGAIDYVVPAGEKVSIPLVIAFHREGIVTSGIECRYFYERFFPTLDSVFSYGLEHFSEYKDAALKMNLELEESKLSADQKFQVAQSVHSYYGSSQLLDHEGEPFWVINEGEYRMMNTLDLTADQLFYELKQNPWTTRNVLENYIESYQYEDRVFLPGEPENEFAGGISFAHDMGVYNCFTRKGTSCYEVSGLKGCFSFMTHEELVNWLCCASAYCHSTKDRNWQKKYLSIFEQCFESLCHRDHPDPALRNGIMGLDSNFTKGGAEITTYDSLDVSLGQARNNTYLAVKTWACYLALEKIFLEEGLKELAGNALEQARKASGSILDVVDENGTIPAVIEEGNTSVIIPIIEGLVFPGYAGCEHVFDDGSEFKPFIDALRVHFNAVLKKDICLFDSGAWKLSSTSINSWLSKIYLCQYVARDILGVKGPSISELADAGHVEWLTESNNSWWAWGDQFYDGVVKGSRYYPRGVTSILWLDE